MLARKHLIQRGLRRALAEQHGRADAGASVTSGAAARLAQVLCLAPSLCLDCRLCVGPCLPIRAHPSSPEKYSAYLSRYVCTCACVCVCPSTCPYGYAWGHAPAGQCSSCDPRRGSGANHTRGKTSSLENSLGSFGAGHLARLLWRRCLRGVDSLVSPCRVHFTCVHVLVHFGARALSRSAPPCPSVPRSISP